MRTRMLCLLLPLALAACATTTPYQPSTKGLGYTEQRLETNRYRVAFTGSSATTPETVQNYLMYRAAEITLQNGYDYFVVAGQSRSTQAAVSGARPSVGVGIGGGSGGFGSGVSIGLGTVLGGGNQENQTAQADIVLYKGTKPAGELGALDAREIKANLEAGIQRPQPRS